MRSRTDARIGSVVHSVRPQGESREQLREVQGGEEEAATESELDVEDEAEKGKRDAHKMTDPRRPSELEVEEHAKTHLPYRSWCRHCFRRRCKNMDHRRGKEGESGHELHMDFGFIGKEKEPGKTATVLVAKERRTKMLLATVVPSKSTGDVSAKWAVAFLREIGCE
jgi:hypothetical protein